MLTSKQTRHKPRKEAPNMSTESTPKVRSITLTPLSYTAVLDSDRADLSEADEHRAVLQELRIWQCALEQLLSTAD